VRAFLAACAFLGGCAGLTPPAAKPEAAALGPGEIFSAQAARGAITVGTSTKADVRAALGKAVTIDFESGYEVWVYRERLREKATPPRTEFVLLFDPSGILTATRVR
jgi:hypothetical protein